MRGVPTTFYTVTRRKKRHIMRVQPITSIELSKQKCLKGKIRGAMKLSRLRAKVRPKIRLHLVISYCLLQGTSFLPLFLLYIFRWDMPFVLPSLLHFLSRVSKTKLKYFLRASKNRRNAAAKTITRPPFVMRSFALSCRCLAVPCG